MKKRIVARGSYWIRQEDIDLQRKRKGGRRKKGGGKVVHVKVRGR